MKLDSTTMFEWQRHSQDHTDIPDYQELLDFLNLRAQAAEASTEKRVSKPINSIVTSTTSTDNCISREAPVIRLCQVSSSPPRSELLSELLTPWSRLCIWSSMLDPTIEISSMISSCRLDSFVLKSVQLVLCEGLGAKLGCSK